ncbi:PLP-dependent aminotransferase family protein [Acidisphaera sp. L21]|uniref:MocR-like pyridoxine biosynthesis transcription factor PdxR n=1 Tax=Acidisphaera sp. L21 TaxID=1641851 RepID=UPI00131D66AE|nr:PLP-dependent aminotransferase family protein [Acidisphaera sp. L21]
MRNPSKAAPLGLALDATGREPLHRQIGAELRRAILERRLAGGMKLPSSRLMAVELACARGTVLLALEQLIAEGYIVARPGSGMSVAADLPDEMLAAPAPAIQGPPRQAATMRAGPDAALRIGQPDRDFPFPLWAKLLEAEWRRPSWAIAGMPHPFGHPGLRAAIADHLGALRGFRCDPAEVVVTTGIRESVTLLARLLLAPGEQAWMEEPGYPGIRLALEAAGVRAVAVAVDEAGFVPDRAMALAPGARLAVVAPAHHFPLGIVLSLQRRLALLAWAERTGGWIVEDDYDGEYRYSGRPLSPLRALDRSGRVAFVGSFSKLLFPALRLSYLVLPRALAGPAEVALAGGGASMLGQGALARFIAEGHFAAHLRRTRRIYAERQAAMIEAMRTHCADRLTIVADPGGMHLVARPLGEFDDAAAVRAAASMNLAPSALSVCYASAPACHGLLLGYAALPVAEMNAAVRRLRAALALARN